MPDTSYEDMMSENNEQVTPEQSQPAARMPTGTIVLTLRGALPVEELRRGDRVCTCKGACPIKRVRTHGEDHYVLDFDRLDFSDDQSVFVLDEAHSAQYRQNAD